MRPDDSEATIDDFSSKNRLCSMCVDVCIKAFYHKQYRASLREKSLLIFPGVRISRVIVRLEGAVSSVSWLKLICDLKSYSRCPNI